MNHHIAMVNDLFAKGDHIHALEILEDLMVEHTEAKESRALQFEQSKIFIRLAKKSENPDVEFAYELAAVSCVSEIAELSKLCAHGLYDLAKQSGSILYYKMFLMKAYQFLSIPLPENLMKQKKGLEPFIEKAELKIAESKTSPLKKCESGVLESKVCESKNNPDPLKNEKKELRSFWLRLDVKSKRDFMKVSVEELLRFTEGVYNKEGLEVLEEILTSARKDRKWTLWMCRTCSVKFSSAKECINHLEQEHAADFKPSSEEDMVKPIGKDWAHKITAGAWEPVDAIAAAEMMKSTLAVAKTFKANNGWSKEWPLAVDEERSKLLMEIKLLLTSIRDQKALSSSIRNWLISFPVRHLGKLGVSETKFDEFHLVKTPQSICFLECHDLIHIRDFLKTIKCERDDGTDLVCRAVDSFLDRTRVKEKIDFDSEFSILLLDKRLLKCIDASFDDEGTINFFDPNNHYSEAHAKGDHIISWLLDYSSVDKIRPMREHNLDIWVAVLRAVQFTCRTLGTKYAQKVCVLGYEAALTVVENLCMSEDERRRNLQEQWTRYGSLLCERCEKSATENSISSNSLLCAVRDVLEGALHPTFGFSNSEDCLRRICELKSRSNDLVMNSIHHLKSVVARKVLRKESKILLIGNSRTRLLDKLTRLSVFDHRTYMLRLLKPFLLNEIVNMELKAKSDAANAEFSLKEGKKSQSEKKNKQNKNSKRPSTNTSRPLDKTVKHESSVKLELEKTSPPLETVEEDSMEPEDTLESEIGRLEISSNADNQQEATEIDHDSLSEPLESALGVAGTIYNSAFDMTLKALLNIRVLKEDLKKNGDLENPVPFALQNFFTAFGSEEIKNEEIYRVLLSNLLASLKEAVPMSNDAAEVLVDILEFWQCWKNPEGESLVTRLFTYEGNERTSCRKCRRESNGQEQSSYGIVMAADSIRELKCAFGNMKFVDILKLIRMENKMLCDKKTGGCGKTNFVQHIISKCPPIFPIVLEWEKSETDKGISETAKALDWEIDMSRLYEGLEPNTNYRLVSMVGCSEEEEHICLAYETIRWVNLRRESFEADVVGTWKSVVKFCEERKVRPVILLYEKAANK